MHPTQQLSILRRLCWSDRCPLRRVRRVDAFTILELIVVIAVILILVGVVLAAAGYVQKKGARSRAETEIAALSAALESYKADNAIYASNGDTDALNANALTSQDQTTAANPAASPNPNAYQKASKFLYGQLSGDFDYDGKVDSSARMYFNFKPAMLYMIITGGPGNNTTTTVDFVRDPFGNSYGYSTIQSATKDTTKGYNPTFDLWSTAGGTAIPNGSTFAEYQQQWIKNW